MAKKPPAKTPEPEAPKGGPVSAGSTYVVGEKGVETIGPPGGKTIDERMADLLREHQEMGARPK